jgi:hypothetical protein
VNQSLLRRSRKYVTRSRREFVAAARAAAFASTACVTGGVTGALPCAGHFGASEAAATGVVGGITSASLMGHLLKKVSE